MKQSRYSNLAARGQITQGLQCQKGLPGFEKRLPRGHPMRTKEFHPPTDREGKIHWNNLFIWSSRKTPRGKRGEPNGKIIYVIVRSPFWCNFFRKRKTHLVLGVGPDVEKISFLLVMGPNGPPSRFVFILACALAIILSYFLFVALAAEKGIYRVFREGNEWMQTFKRTVEWEGAKRFIMSWCARAYISLRDTKYFNVNCSSGHVTQSWWVRWFTIMWWHR